MQNISRRHAALLFIIVLIVAGCSTPPPSQPLQSPPQSLQSPPQSLQPQGPTLEETREQVEQARENFEELKRLNIKETYLDDFLAAQENIDRAEEFLRVAESLEVGETSSGDSGEAKSAAGDIWKAYSFAIKSRFASQRILQQYLQHYRNIEDPLKAFIPKFNVILERVESVQQTPDFAEVLKILGSSQERQDSE